MVSRFFPHLIAAAAAFVLIGTDSAAQTERKKPAPFPEFSAKREKPPKAGSRKRITVQITPQGARAGAVVGGQASGGDGGATRAASNSYAWFWDDVSPLIAQSGPGRLQMALTRIANPPAGQGVGAPRLQTLSGIAQSHGREILKSTVGKKVSPALVLAVIAVESAGRSDAVSHAGAQGLMQLMPATAARFGVSDSMVAAQNIAGGVAYLDWLMGEFNGDPVLVLAAYNAGEGAVRKNAGVPPYAETRGYVPKVLAAFQVAKGLCMTPPQLATDGCVFRNLGG